MSLNLPDALDGHVLLTGANGAPRDPVAAARTLGAMSKAEHVVIHFHGGLVSQQRGLEVAASLKPVYERTGAYPVFVVWRSGLIEIISGNLAEIAREDAFRRMLRSLLRHVVGKLTETAGARAVGGTLPPERDINVELARRDAGAEPFGDLDPDPGVSDPSAEEERSLDLAIRTDVRLQASLQAAVNERLPEPRTTTSRGLTAGVIASENTLLDPAALEEIAPASDAGARAIVSMTFVARKCLRILARVIARFRSRTDHGVYVTVVEELLREFYLANAGAIIWHAMKQETLDTFVPADPPRGGDLLLGALARARARRISLVGHSTGAVFINAMLGEIEQRLTDATFGPDFRVDDVVFLAPACYVHRLRRSRRATSSISGRPSGCSR